MKIGLFLGNQLPEIGGGYTYQSEILNFIIKLDAKSGHTFVLLSWDKEPPKDILSYQHIEFISLYRDFKTRLQSKIKRTVIAILKKLRHPSSQFQINGWHEKFASYSIATNGIDIIWYLGPWCISMEVPYIITVWDLQHRRQPYFPEVSRKGEWDQREQFYATRLRRASYVITGTHAGKAEIERFYQLPSERIKILPFPTPKFVLAALANEGKEVLAKYNLPEGYLFYPAQFWPHKNHVGLLLTIKLLRDKYNLIFPVVFVGSDKGNKPHIKQVVTELELSEQIHFLGFVPQEDLISLYRNAFALTFVTFFGPDNLPPLEAFALSCPVVASEVSGAQEQLGDAALLVDPKKPEQIALAIKSLWDDKHLRQTLVQRGLARASQWTGQDYVKAVFSILDEFEAIRRCWSHSQSYHHN